MPDTAHYIIRADQRNYSVAVFECTRCGREVGPLHLGDPVSVVADYIAAHDSTEHAVR